MDFEQDMCGLMSHISKVPKDLSRQKVQGSRMSSYVVTWCSLLVLPDREFSIEVLTGQ